MDEQIFAIQPYGGISRMFAELAKQFLEHPELGVEVLPLNAPVINRYVLDNPFTRTRLAVRDAVDQRDPGVCGIRLYVERENTRAQATYRHCGMGDAGYTVMETVFTRAAIAAGGERDAG